MHKWQTIKLMTESPQLVGYDLSWTHPQLDSIRAAAGYGSLKSMQDLTIARLEIPNFAWQATKGQEQLAG